MSKYMQFYDMVKKLEDEGKRFDKDSLKLLRYGDLDLAGIGNAGKACCHDWDAIKAEQEYRVNAIKDFTPDDIEKDKGVWKIIDDMAHYYAYYRSKVVKVDKTYWPRWKVLVEAMKNLRGNWSGGRDSEHLAEIYELIPQVIAEGIVPEGWCVAVKANADQFDGEFNDGRIMRDGALHLPSEVASQFGIPGNAASGNLAKMMGAESIVRASGYRGSYDELFADILTPEQKIMYLVPSENEEE